MKRRTTFTLGGLIRRWSGSGSHESLKRFALWSPLLFLVPIVGWPSYAGSVSPMGHADAMSVVGSCDPTVSPCAPVIEGAFGAKMQAKPDRPHRSWVVVCKDPARDSGCDYGSIRAAYNALEYNFREGDSGFRGRIRTIRVKPGVYTVADEGGTLLLGGFNGSVKGSSSLPMALVAFDPANRPVLRGTCTVSSCPEAANKLRQTLVIGAEYWLIDGIQSERMDWGMYIDSDRVTIRNSVVRDALAFGINVSQRIRGFLLIERNQIESVGTSYLHHGIYVSLGQDTSKLTSVGGCAESTLKKAKKEGIVIRGNLFRNLPGSAIQLNASNSNWTDHGSISGFDGTRIPDTGIHGTVIENNVILDTAFGINLYRYSFSTRIVNNTFIATTDGKQRNSGHFLQIRNGAFNVIANNLFYSNIPAKSALVGYKECSKDPSNDFNVLNYNLWCMPADSRYSWNRGGSGVTTDRLLSSLKGHTGQEGQGRIELVGSGICSGLNLTTASYVLPDSKRLVVSNQGVEILPASGTGTIDFNKDGRLNGGDVLARTCPSTDFAGQTRSGDGCDIGAHEYGTTGNPPDPGEGGSGGGGTDPGGGTTPVDPSISPVPLPTDLPEGTQFLVLQQGFNGYAGAADSHIQENDPASNFGSEANVGATGDWPLGSGRDDHGLLRWGNLGSSNGLDVLAAEIWVYVVVPTSATGYPLYALRRPWAESTASWNTPWQQPGAADPTDRGDTPLGVVLPTEAGWHRVALNAAGLAVVQQWLENPDSNHGLILTNPDNPNDVIFRSANYSTRQLRPALVIALGEDTGSGGGTDPGGGGTDPGGGGTDPGGGGTDPGGGGTDPVDPSVSPVPLPTDLPEGTQFLVFQQDFNGYAGASDSHIQEDQPGTNFGSDSNVGAIGDWPAGSGRDDHGLLRWSNLGSGNDLEVLAAEIWLYAIVPTSTPGYHLYALKRSWDESTVTWNAPWAEPGASDPTDRGDAPLGLVMPAEAGWHRVVLNAAGRTVVQQWLEDPSSNHGLILANPDNPDDVIFRSSNIGTRQVRPVLVIALGESVTPPPQQVVSGLDVQQLQQGRDGYFGSSGTFIREGDPTRAYGNGPLLIADGDAPYLSGKDDRILIRWGDLTVPVGSTLEKAEIWVYVTDPTLGAPFMVYEVRRPWSAATATWQTPWATAGASSPTDMNPEPIGEFLPTSTGWHPIPLSASGIALVQRWVDDPGTNYGFMIMHGENPNAVAFASTTYSEENRRPILSVGFRRMTAITPQPPGEATAVFQQGLDGYQGVEDTQISESRSQDSGGSLSFLSVDGDAPFGTGLDERILIKWTGLGLPPTAEVVGAEVWLYISDPTGSPGVDLYGLARPWSAATATWSQPWAEPGAWGETDRDTTVLATLTPRETGWHRVELNQDGLELVNRWAADPATNHGILFAHPQNENSLRFYSSKHPTGSSRPMLLIRYREGDVPLGSIGPVTDNVVPEVVLSDRAEFQGDLPREFILHQNYPNPFNASTTIQYGLPQETELDLSLFDLLGRRVMTLVGGRKGAGVHSVLLDASSLPGGMYLCVMAYNGTSQSRKLLLVK